MRMLCIDPGTPFGWAFWEKTKLRRWGVGRSNAKTWYDRSSECADHLYDVIGHTGPEVVCCEMPVYMPGAAAAAGGNLVKLCCTVGRFMEVCDSRGVRFEPVAVKDWLGQMTDRAIRHRVESILGDEAKLIPDHVIDAVGIGLHVLGKWPKG